MCHRLSLGVVLVTSLFVCAHHAEAGQAQTNGTIVGQVTDESGAVLPGVTVTVKSPALQVPQVTDLTDGQGDYRITPLPIGTYEVAYTLPGFQTVRHDNVRLTAGFIARVDAVLKVGALEESVTVSATPTIDVQSTGSVTVLTRETLEVVPSSRAGIITLMNQSPAVRSQLDVGGSQSNQLPAMRVYGISTQATSWLVLDGVVTTDAGQTGGGGSYFDYASFEEARMQTIANDVETPNRGINLNLIVKSGGNTFTATRPGNRRAASSPPRISTTHCEGWASPRPTISAAGFMAAPTSAAELFGTSCGSTAVCAAARIQRTLSACSRRTARLVWSTSRNSWSPIKSLIRRPGHNGSSSLTITRGSSRTTPLR